MPYARGESELSQPALNEAVKLGVFLVITITFQDAVSLADQTQLDSSLNLQPVNQMKALSFPPSSQVLTNCQGLYHGFLPHQLSIKLKVSIEALISRGWENFLAHLATRRTLMSTQTRVFPPFRS